MNRVVACAPDGWIFLIWSDVTRATEEFAKLGALKRLGCIPALVEDNLGVPKRPTCFMVSSDLNGPYVTKLTELRIQRSFCDSTGEGLYE